MADSIEIDGWKVRLRFRTIKKKRKVNGRTRGRYEGKYVYVRITSPNHQVRDVYLGTTSSARSSTSSIGGRKSRAGELELAPAARGRNGGQKARITPEDEPTCDVCGGVDGMTPGNPFCSYCSEDEEFSGVAIAKARRKR